MLERVRVPGGAARDFPPCSAANFRCRLWSYSVRATHVCNIACINICGHVKNPKLWQPYHCIDTLTKILHTLIGLGSAAPAAAVPYPGKD